MYIFDFFIFGFAILTGLGLIKLTKQRPLNWFGLGFAGISFAAFAFISLLVILNWVDWLGPFGNVVGRFIPA